MTSDEYLMLKMNTHQVVELQKKKPKKSGVLKALFSSCFSPEDSRLLKWAMKLLGLNHTMAGVQDCYLPGLANQGEAPAFSPDMFVRAEDYFREHLQ